MAALLAIGGVGTGDDGGDTYGGPPGRKLAAVERFDGAAWAPAPPLPAPRSFFGAAAAGGG